MPAVKAPRNVCFTLNNPTDDEIKHIQFCAPDVVRYMVTGFEVGESGTPHIQGYVELNAQLNMNQLKKLLCNRAHFEPRGGSPKQAAGYCKKGSDESENYEDFFPRTVDEPESWTHPFEYGTISSQGKRTDITAPVEMITEGSTMREVARAFPEQYVKYHKGFRDLRSLMLEPRCLSQAPEVIVLYGPTLSGKTRDAHIKYWPDEPHYMWRPSNGKWFDGYDGQKKIIIEEMRYRSMSWEDILALFDRNEFLVPIKGGFVHIQADKFVITSPIHPSRWYSGGQDDNMDQLHRRITQVIEYHGPTDEVDSVVLPVNF